MDNIIFYKQYSRKIMGSLSKLSYMSKKYMKYSSIVNRLVEWEIVDVEVF